MFTKDKLCASYKRIISLGGGLDLLPHASRKQYPFLSILGLKRCDSSGGSKRQEKPVSSAKWLCTSRNGGCWKNDVSRLCHGHLLVIVHGAIIRLVQGRIPRPGDFCERIDSLAGQEFRDHREDHQLTV